MKHGKPIRAMWWVVGLLLLAWMLGMVPVALAPVDHAWAGFFDKVKKGSDNTPAPADDSKQKQSGSSQGEVKEKPAPQPKSESSGGFFSAVKQKPSAPPQPDENKQSGSSGSKGSGFFYEVKQNPSAAPQPTAPQITPAPQPKPGSGGFFKTQERPRPSTGAVRDSAGPSAPGGYRPRPRGEGLISSQSGLHKVQSAPRHGWTSRGYFEQLGRERERRRRDDLHLRFWYYPYDYAFYCWRHYHYDPWYVWPYYVVVYTPYQYFYYYYAAPPTIILHGALDSVYGETYIPYVTWASNSLMEAKRDIEEAWRRERIELLERYLDADHTIASYFRDEYTHGLSPEEFRQLTLDAFSAIRTVSFELTSVRYVSTREWARLQGTHIFYDPYDTRTVVKVSYLLRRAESETGRLRWVIWEVRQWPEAN